MRLIVHLLNLRLGLEWGPNRRKQANRRRDLTSVRRWPIKGGLSLVDIWPINGYNMVNID